MKDDSHFPPTPGDPTVNYSVNNKALDFDGVNDYVATASNISALNITGDITISSWINISSMPPSYFRIVGKGSGNNRTYGLWIRYDGKLLFQQHGSGGKANLYSNTALSTGAWYHIAATRSGNTLTIYVNGVANVTMSYSHAAISNTDPLTIGYGTFHTYHPGKLDEVAVWDKGLSAAEITALYNSGGGLDASSNSGNYNSSNNLKGYWLSLIHISETTRPETSGG